MALTRDSAVRDLRELIEAIDRRVPRLARTGEAIIMRDAAVLKARAIQRIAECEAPLTP